MESYESKYMWSIIFWNKAVGIRLQKHLITLFFEVRDKTWSVIRRFFCHFLLDSIFLILNCSDSIEVAGYTSKMQRGRFYLFNFFFFFLCMFIISMYLVIQISKEKYCKAIKLDWKRVRASHMFMLVHMLVDSPMKPFT